MERIRDHQLVCSAPIENTLFAVTTHNRTPFWHLKQEEFVIHLDATHGFCDIRT
jgi:hypothetical protein